MLAPVLDEDPVVVEPRRDHARFDETMGRPGITRLQFVRDEILVPSGLALTARGQSQPGARGLILGLLALVGASEPVESQQITVRSDSAGVEIVTSDPSLSDAVCTLGDEPVFRVGDDESNEATWFSTIRGMGRLSDGSVAVLDRASAEIRIFDPDGRHVRSMGRRGEGPGEFRSAWKLWVLPGDTLWAGDYRPWRYNVFTRDGEWVRAVQMKPVYGNPSRRGGVLDNGVSVNTVERHPVPRDFGTPDTVVVEVHGPDGERLATLGRILHTTYGPHGMYQIFTASALVEAGGSTIALGRTTETEVRLLDDELRVRRILRWSDSDRDVRGADVRAWRDDYIERRGGRDSPDWRPLDEEVVSGEVPAADVFPAFSYVEIGRDGRVWVLPYRKPREERRRWMGFDPDGGFLCHLENSHTGLVTYEFGADYWLGTHTDELGVETVVVHELTTPGGG